MKLRTPTFTITLLLLLLTTTANSLENSSSSDEHPLFTHASASQLSGVRHTESIARDEHNEQKELQELVRYEQQLEQKISDTENVTTTFLTAKAESSTDRIFDYITASILMGYGLICTVWGYRLIKITAPISVALLGFFITYTIADVASSLIWYAVLFIACGPGFLFGLLGKVYLKFGMYGTAFFGGMCGALFVLALRDGGLAQGKLGAFVIFALPSVFLMVMSFLFEKWVYVISITAVGAFLFAMSLDNIIGGNLKFIAQNLLCHQADIKPTWYTYVEFDIYVGLIAGGICVQYFRTARGFNHASFKGYVRQA